jgi:O-acetylhomoserine (thiol)-lyase
MNGLNSKLIHGNIEKTGFDDVFGSMKTPIYQTGAYGFATCEDLEKSFIGQNRLPAYSRSANPTVTELESRLKMLSGARGAICLSSGMAAITNLTFALCQSGDNIITSRFLFGNTLSFFAQTVASFGIEARLVDFADPSSIEKAIDEKTRFIFLESVTNPQMFVADFDAITAIGKKHHVVTVIDNTLLTSYVFDAKAHGFDVEVLSTSKHISGGATSIGGALLFYDTDKYAGYAHLADFYKKFGTDALFFKLRKEVFRNMGSCMSPETAFFQLLGLETLTLRIDKSVDNAVKVAQYLAQHPKVLKTEYPGLPQSPYYKLSQKYFGGKASCMLHFELANRDTCYAFMNKLQMIKRGTNLCDNKSLIIHPESTIFAEFSKEEKERAAINSRMIRLSVGIEDIEDIIADIEQALA